MIDRVSFLLAIPLALAFVSTPASIARPLGSREGVELAARVDKLFAPYVHADSPGAALLVVQNGHVVIEKGYGLADIATRRPITPDTRFLLASVTKQFTAMAIMMLAERGRLRYDDPLTKFFPQFPAYARTITIRHLLDHQAGLPEYDELFVESGKIDKDWPRSSTTKPSAYEPTSKDTLALLAEVRAPDFAAGERFEYSNSGYVILAQIVERVSGQSFSRFLRENIFEPLGMKNTLLYDESRPSVPGVATGYTSANKGYRDIAYTPLNLIYGDGNIYSTLGDMYLWDQALYTNALVRPETLQEAFTPHKLKDGTATQYGFGWLVQRYLGLDVLDHDGSGPGFSTQIFRIPSERFTVVILANLDRFDASETAAAVAKIYLADKLSYPKTVRLDEQVERRVAGHYQLAPGRIMEIIAADGVVKVNIPGVPSFTLRPESEVRYFVDGREESEFLFDKDKSGNVTTVTTPGGRMARKL